MRQITVNLLAVICRVFLYGIGVRFTDHACKNGNYEDVVRIRYGYDYAGNRTYREGPVAKSHNKKFDEPHTLTTASPQSVPLAI